VLTCVPETGDWLITDPDGTVVLDRGRDRSNRQRRAGDRRRRAACERPTTFGTATWGGPDETTSDTALPVLTCVPPTAIG
jgi:hypothetical protein